MTLEEKAKKHGLSRQAYTKRLNNWVKAVIDGKECLVNPSKFMVLKDSDKK